MVQDVGNLNAVLNAIGPFNRFHWGSSVLLWLSSASAGVAVVVFAFAAFVPAHRCVVPECETLTDTYYAYAENKTFPEHLTTAFGTNSPSEIIAATSSCKRYSFNDDDDDYDDKLDACKRYKRKMNSSSPESRNVTYCTSEELIFDRSVVNSSLAIDFGFTCQWRWLHAVYNAIYMGGMLAGSFCFGILSDRYGRKPALMLAVAVVSVAGTISAFVHIPPLFGVLRFLTGMGGMACYIVAYVLNVEATTARYSVRMATICFIGFIMGEATLGIEAYFIRDWFPLLMVAYVPMSIALVLWFLIPESARWLISKGQIKKANQVLETVARINGSEWRSNNNDSEKPQITAVEQKAKDVASSNLGLLSLVRPRTILQRTLNMGYQWFSVTMGFYGITFSLTTLSEKPHSNFLLGTACELPGVLFSLFCTDILGRRLMLIVLQSLAGVACIAAGLLHGYDDLKGLQVCLALLGKFATTSAFNTVYLYTAELYPTAIRNTAIGLCSTMARVGGITALLLQALSEVWKPLPMVIMGCVASVAGVSAFFFPETTGQPLPETMEQALNVGKDSGFRPFSCLRRNRASAKSEDVRMH